MSDRPNLRASVQLLAEAATVDDVDVRRRIIEGTVVPYGEAGRASLDGVPWSGRVRAGAVRFTNMSSPLVLGLYGHDRSRPVSRLIAMENRADRLRARFRVGPGPLGDQLLAEADPQVGVRSMLSIELDGCLLDLQTGDIIDGVCDYVAHVPIGAYDSARVDHVAAALYTPNPTGDDVLRRSTFHRQMIEVGGGQPAQQAAPPSPAALQQAQQLQAAVQLLPGGQPAPAPQQQQQQAPAPQPAPLPMQWMQPAPAPQQQLQAQVAPPAPAPVPQQQQAPAQQWVLQPVGQPPAPQQQQGPSEVQQLLAGLAQMQAGAYAAPAQGQAQLPGGPGAMGNAPQTPATPPGNPVQQFARLQAAVMQGNSSHQLQAALADITNTGLDLFQRPAGAIGEQLWQGASYTRRYVQLMRRRPLTSWKGDGWEWTKKPKVEKYEGDKAPIPTGTVSVRAVEWEAERVAGGWDIDRKLRDFADSVFWEGFYDAQTESYREITDDIAADQIIAAARDITVDANVPAGYTDMNVAQANVLKAAALGTAILEDTPNVRQGPDYIVMNTMDWLRLIDFTQLDLPAFLSLLKVKPENFLRSSKVAPGKLVAGVINATTFRELGDPNGTPIRVEALNVAQAGIDSAVYGYCATSHDRPGGVISVPIAPVVPDEDPTP